MGLPETRAAVLFFLGNGFLARNDQALAQGVDLDDLEFKRMSDNIFLADISEHGEACRQEPFQTVDIDDKAALDFLAHKTVNQVPFFESLIDLVPAVKTPGLVAGKDDHAVIIFDRIHVDFHFLANGQVRQAREFLARHSPFGLVAYVDQDVFDADPDDIALDDLSFLDLFETLFVELR